MANENETQAQKCERCSAYGLRDDEDCPCYGEPNGCNSPTPGEFPSPKNLGDSAKLREALVEIRTNLLTINAWGDKSLLDGKERWIIDTIDVALAAPPRNCERFKTKEDAALAFADECGQWIPQSVLWQLAPWLDWLFAPVTEKEGGNDGN